MASTAQPFLHCVPSDLESRSEEEEDFVRTVIIVACASMDNCVPVSSSPAKNTVYLVSSFRSVIISTCVVVWEAECTCPSLLMVLEEGGRRVVSDTKRSQRVAGLLVVRESVMEEVEEGCDGERV